MAGHREERGEDSRDPSIGARDQFCGIAGAQPGSLCGLFAGTVQQYVLAPRTYITLPLWSRCPRCCRGW